MSSPNLTETEERAHLRFVRQKLQAQLDNVLDLVAHQSGELLELKRYLSEHKADMDHVEKVGVRQTVDELGAVGDHSALGAVRLQKLLRSPYFGRIDFATAGDAHARPLYVGIHSFHDGSSDAHLVHDWRAPVSSMFYDYEQGPAAYDAPEGRVRGEIHRKRQYRIEDGELVFMLESSLNIHDDVLQKELSRSASDKMKNIVATIQRDQNAIVRNEAARALVIQGAAGSGKTSIALHRIAFLLYRFKDTIKAEDVLILSPNKVFAHYISNVLPELGEENIRETTMEALASRLLGPKIRFQTFAEQVSALFDERNDPFRARIRFKATTAFLDKLDAYARHVKNGNFEASAVEVGRHVVPAEALRDWFHRLGEGTVAARINALVEAIAGRLARDHSHELKPTERASIRKQLKGMFGSTNLETLYKGFYAWLEEPSLFCLVARGVYEYADVFPLVYFKLRLEGLAPFEEVRHLVVDEMQDYTPVQYSVLAHLFPCNKTILGDAYQAVNPLSSSKAEGIRELIPGAQCVYLNKSYRSTVEISQLAQRVNPNKHLEPIERHGEEPSFHACADDSEEIAHLRTLVSAHLSSDLTSLGIVCKTQADAARAFDAIRDLSLSIQLIDAASVTFERGVTVATAHLAKGLEFDAVILPFCNDATYHNEIDRHMLYVGCTRAMHRLDLTYTGTLTRLFARVA